VAANGRKVEALAYATGYAPDPGQRLAVTYLRSQPDVARVEGMRRTTFGPLAAMAGIFPLKLTPVLIETEVLPDSALVHEDLLA